MPRTGRGGRRQGDTGTAYGNRTDLQENRPLPIETVPGQGYGEAAKQREAQRAIPMAPAPASPGVVPGVGGGGSEQPPPPPSKAPGELLWTHPTTRPNEPITAGLNTGPGPGSEAITGVGAAGRIHENVADLLNELSNVPGATPDVKALAQYAQSRA